MPLADPLNDIPDGDLFRISLDREKLCDLLVLTGQINLDAAAQLREQALQLAAVSRPVEIDWSGVGHLCPAAVQVLLALGMALSGAAQLRIRRDNRRVRDFLELAGLSDRFRLAEPEAVAD